MEPLVDREVLAQALRGGPWTVIETVTTTGSTNADLAALARAGAPGGRVLVADHQSSGRGRFTRVWEAPPGSSVAVSVLLRPLAPVRRWLWLPLLAGLGVVDGLRTLEVPARLKWPNDALLDGRKLCGILAERVESPSGPAAVIGMGINTTLTAGDLPVPTATSLALAGYDLAPTLVVAAVLSSLQHWYERWQAGEDLRPAYAVACDTLGREVRVATSATESVRGFAEGVDPDGCLLVRTDGTTRSFAAGDVWHLR